MTRQVWHRSLGRSRVCASVALEGLAADRRRRSSRLSLLLQILISFFVVSPFCTVFSFPVFSISSPGDSLPFHIIVLCCFFIFYFFLPPFLLCPFLDIFSFLHSPFPLFPFRLFYTPLEEQNNRNPNTKGEATAKESEKKQASYH